VERTLVVSTTITFSIGRGQLKFRPEPITRVNLPKRSTTPRWLSSTRVQES
jgi:hypothetical protein